MSCSLSTCRMHGCARISSADASEGFAGAEIEQAVVTAVYCAAARQEKVDSAHLLDALNQTSPLSVVMAERIQTLRDWARGRAVMAD